MRIGEKQVSSIINKTNLPGADYVINPYIGCLHGCKYCYACFLKRFIGIDEEWGKFAIAKTSWKSKLNPQKYENKRVLIGSVTDPYQMLENKYKVTRQIVEKFIDTNAELEIITKSKLVLRDIDLFKKHPNIRIGVSLGMLDDDFRKLIEPGASSVNERLEILKELKENNIRNYLFISPIFPKITPIEELIEKTRSNVNYYLFENLNLRSSYKNKVLDLIKEYRPDLTHVYDEIYVNKNSSLGYWNDIAEYLKLYGSSEELDFRIYFKY